MRRALLALRTDVRGNSFVELGLVAPILATLLVGTVDLSRAYSQKLALEQAAQRAIEHVQRSEYKTEDAGTYETDAEDAAGSGATATVTDWLECNNDGVKLDYDDGVCANATDPFARYVEITVQQTFTPMFRTSWVPGANADGTFTMRSTAGVRTQ